MKALTEYYKSLLGKVPGTMKTKQLSEVKEIVQNDLIIAYRNFKHNPDNKNFKTMEQTMLLHQHYQLNVLDMEV